MALEIKNGRGPIIFDVSQLHAEDMDLLKPQTGWQKLNYDKLCKIGLDIFKDNTEWVPQITVSHGGIEADADGDAGIPGFFVAGTARSLEPGVYAGGFALMTTSVTGYRAGEAAAGFLKNDGGELLPVDDARINDCRKRLQDWGGKNKNSLHPKEVLRKIQSIIFPYEVSIIKNGKALLKASTELEKIQNEDLPRMRADDPHCLLKLKEVEAICFVSRLYVDASNMRKETRAGHYREDYPHMDPAGPAWLFLKKDGAGKPHYFWRKVPLETYPAPFKRCYQDNFNFSG